MKLIVPMARRPVRGTSKFVPPSPLLNLVGRPILLRVLDVVKDLKVSEVIFIVDKDSVELKRLVSNNFDFKARYILQKRPRGVAHAVYGAKKFLDDDEPCVVLFADSIIDADVKFLNKRVKEDAIIWTKQVDDPRSFGVVFTHNGFVTRLIEKPDTPVSDLAMVGMYYFSKSKSFFDSIAYLIKNNILTKGVFQVTDALQIMINKGAKVLPKEVKSWLDCGSKKRLLEAHKHVIVEHHSAKLPKDNVFIKPVFVEQGAKIVNSVVGPNVSVGKNAKIHRSVVCDAIISEDALVENHIIRDSFVGKQAKIYGSSRKFNVKDRGVVRDE